ncbi:hypothetical protein PAXRUDRAFT_769037, partial [Paxillus rubicundulus Ve08.2h10]
RKVGDAMDVDNSGDYKEMTKKINDERLAVVKIFIDVKDVEKLPHGISEQADGEVNWTSQMMSHSRYEYIYFS